jgi:hypothetical protein
MLKTLIKPQGGEFIRRWAKNPKIVFFASPNSFQDEIIKRLSIDLGIPILSMTQIFSNI